MENLLPMLHRVELAHVDALEAAPNPSSKPFRAAKAAFKKRISDLAAALQQLGQEREKGWVSVTDDLPDDDTLVLIALNDDDVWTGFRDAGIWRYVDAMPIDAERVTHWQPMPQPPVRIPR